MLIPSHWLSPAWNLLAVTHVCEYNMGVSSSWSRCWSPVVGPYVPQTCHLLPAADTNLLSFLSGSPAWSSLVLTHRHWRDRLTHNMVANRIWQEYRIACSDQVQGSDKHTAQQPAYMWLALFIPFLSASSRLFHPNPPWFLHFPAFGLSPKHPLISFIPYSLPNPRILFSLHPIVSPIA